MRLRRDIPGNGKNGMMSIRPQTLSFPTPPRMEGKGSVTPDKSVVRGGACLLDYPSLLNVGHNIVIYQNVWRNPLLSTQILVSRSQNLTYRN